MKAILCHQDGRPLVLQFQEIETPTPNDNRILVRVLAASVNPLESGMM